MPATVAKCRAIDMVKGHSRMALGDIIARTAQDLIQQLAGLEVALDFTPASLAHLDAAIEMIWGDDAPPPDIFDGMVWGYGCYVAEVLQRSYGGNWQPAEFDGYDLVRDDGTAINPWSWVEYRFRDGSPLAAQHAAACGNLGGT